MLERGFRLARVFGIPVRIDYSWFLIFGLILWMLSRVYFPAQAPGEPELHLWLAGLAGALLFFGSVLAHELSHSLVARALGVRVLGITLFLFGGVSSLASEADDPWKEIKIAAAGPLMSFFLAAFFFTLSGGIGAGASPLLGAVLAYLGLVNAVLGVFNLVPGLPLDGGRVLRAIWWLASGSALQATRAASFAGRLVALGLMLLGLLQAVVGGQLQGLWLVLIGLFLRNASLSAYRDMQVRHLLQGARAGDAMEPLPAGVLSGAAPPGAPVVSWRGPLSGALAAMAASRATSLVVTDDDGRPLGQLTLSGVERYLRERHGAGD